MGILKKGVYYKPTGRPLLGISPPCPRHRPRPRCASARTRKWRCDPRVLPRGGAWSRSWAPAWPKMLKGYTPENPTWNLQVPCSFSGAQGTTKKARAVLAPEHLLSRCRTPPQERLLLAVSGLEVHYLGMLKRAAAEFRATLSLSLFGLSQRKRTDPNCPSLPFAPFERPPEPVCLFFFGRTFKIYAQRASRALPDPVNLPSWTSRGGERMHFARFYLKCMCIQYSAVG